MECYILGGMKAQNGMGAQAEIKIWRTPPLLLFDLAKLAPYSRMILAYVSPISLVHFFDNRAYEMRVCKAVTGLRVWQAVAPWLARDPVEHITNYIATCASVDGNQ